MEWLLGLLVRMAIAALLAGVTMWIINGLLEWDWHMGWMVVIWLAWVLLLYGVTEGLAIVLGDG